jgi:chemotaxis protein methyltransferase CheR
MMHFDRQQKARIRELVHDYSGIVIERVAIRQLDKKLEEQMQLFGVVRIDDYIRILEAYEHNSKAMDELIAELTVSESFFFRNPGQFDYMLEKLLPELISSRSSQIPVRIWSAGCSRGEEAYSIAMTARYFQKNNPDCRFSINAGDINARNLASAREAVYGCRSLRGKLEVFEERYGFLLGEKDQDGNCVVSRDICQMVNLQKLNLKNITGLKCLAGSDIIFCRNVLIYFDESLRQQLVKEFYNCLNPGGVVFLGESECFPGDNGNFELINYGNSYAYRKPCGKR